MFCVRQDLDGLGMLREWIKKTQSITRFIEVDGQRRKGRPCKTWTQLINDGCIQDWHKFGWPGEKPSEKLHSAHARMETDVKRK